MKLFSKHLSFESLLDLAEGRLNDSPHVEAELHTVHCDYCSAELAVVRRIIDAMRGDELNAAPPQAIAQALQLFRPLARSSPVSKPERRTLLSFLRFDSGATPAYGLRSGSHAGQASERQLLFNADDFDLDIRIESSGSDWLVAGQLLGNHSGGRVDLVGSEQQYASEINELGEFAFATVHSGQYQMLIALADVDITIPMLTL